MSDNNLFENLREEERSVDESEMGDSTADFFVEDVPLKDEPTTGQRPGILTDMDAPTGKGVSLSIYSYYQKQAYNNDKSAFYSYT